MEKLADEKGAGFVYPFKRDSANLRNAGCYPYRN